MARPSLALRSLRLLLCATMVGICLPLTPASGASAEYAPARTWPAVTWHLEQPNGMATDAVGNVYVADTGNHRIVKYDVAGRFVTSWGGQGSEDGKFNQPWDVACDPSGTNVFVVDTMNHRVQQFLVHGKTAAFVRKWGTQGGQDFTGTNAGEFEQPRGISLDAGGNVYVVDTGNDRIQKFAVSGAGIRNLRVWGSSGSGASLFLEPWAIDVAPNGWVYVVDRDKTNCYVRVFDSNGDPVQFSAGGNGWGAFSFARRNGYFGQPEGISVDDDGNVYVCDTYITSRWVQKFTSEGEWLAGWGISAEGDAYNNQPAFKSLTGLDASGSGNGVRILVGDRDNDRLREFSAEGIPLTKRDAYGVLGSHGVAWWRFTEPWDVAVGPNGSVYVADRLNHRVERYSSVGVVDVVRPLDIPPIARVDNGYFYEPSSIAYDPVSGFVFVAEAGNATTYKNNNRVQRLDADLNYEGHKWGSYGTGHGEFNRPQGVAVGPSPSGGRWVYVSDTGNNRVEVFELDGTYRATIGGDVLLAPAGISVTDDGSVYVLDSGHKKVTRFVHANDAWTSWTAAMSFGNVGSGDALLTQPWGLDLDAAGSIYVADMGAHVIKKYTPGGAYQGLMGSKGSAQGELNMPRGVAVSSTGVAYVADTVNDRIQSFLKPIQIDIVNPIDLSAYDAAVMPIFNVGAGWVTKGVDLDGAAWMGEPIDTEGVHVLRVWATDVNGLIHEKVVQFTVDLTAPTTQSDGIAAYLNSATVSFSVFDGLSGVDRTFWILDDSSPQSGSSVVTQQAGNHRLEYWSTDLAGNEESPHRVLNFTVSDTLAPVTACDAASIYYGPATITLLPYDAGSGVASTEWRMDGGTWTPGTVAMVSSPGDHHLEYRSTDFLGNIEDVKSVYFAIGTGAPAVPVEHDAAGVTFDRWVSGQSDAYSGGGYVYGRWTDTALSARFSGSTISWIGPKQPGYGKADVYVDNVYKATVDCYAPVTGATQTTTIWESGPLGAGVHTITIRLAGAKNAASTGNVVVVDKFDVSGASAGPVGVRFDERDHSTVSGTWIKASNTTYHEGTYSYSRWSGTSYKATFTGTKVAWIGPRSTSYGKANVYIDGSLKATVDCYGLLGWRYRVWESTTLAPGPHTIEIRPTGTKRASSSNTVVTVDAIDVTP